MLIYLSFSLISSLMVIIFTYSARSMFSKWLRPLSIFNVLITVRYLFVFLIKLITSSANVFCKNKTLLCLYNPRSQSLSKSYKPSLSSLKVKRASSSYCPMCGLSCVISLILASTWIFELLVTTLVNVLIVGKPF
jgi:hypothetical protein